MNRASSCLPSAVSSRHKVAIVGAGPGGAATAIALAQRGIRDVVLLDRAHFPREKTCGSAISPLGLRVLAELGLADDVRRLGYAIHSLRLTTPRQKHLRLRGGEAAVILLRKHFDSLLVDRARALGVVFRDGVVVTSLIEDEGRVLGVRAGGEQIFADYVVCADGAHSRFSSARRPQRSLATIMGWWEDVGFEPGEIEMVFDAALAPLYGWMFPETPSRVNIGIVVDGHRVGASAQLGSARDLFASFLDRHYADRLRGARAVGRWCGHPIAYTTFVRDGGRPGLLYVGESARLTNVATGEGIYQAMRSGLFAAEAVAAVIRGTATETRAWRQYAWRCRRTFTPGFLIGHLFRGAVRFGILDAAVAAFNQPRGQRLMSWAVGSALTGSSISPKAVRTT